MELLKKLYQIYSPSGKERAMTKFIWDYVKRIPGVKLETDKIGNLYITKGDAESYPCIAAHLDQVQRLHSKKTSRLLRRRKLYSDTAPGTRDRKDSERMTRMESG